MSETARLPTGLTFHEINASFQRDGDRAPVLLEEALAARGGERAIMRFLKEHPHVVAFSDMWWGSHALYMFFEFPLGPERFVDILLLGRHSGGWCPTLIEVQAPDPHPLFLKSGDPGPELREGVRQISQWREFINRNEQSFRQELSRRLPIDAGEEEYHRAMQAELRDPFSHFDYRSWVLIGRSSETSPSESRHRNLYVSTLNGIQIASFDRLLASLKEKVRS